MAIAKVGLLWRGERGEAMSPRAEVMLGPLVQALAELDVAVLPVVYADEAVADVRAELMTLDGVVVWVNPIQNGATRADLDALLRDVSDRGVWVSAHPEIIDRLGTKEVLHTTQSVGWAADVAIYRSPTELADAFPARLGSHGRLVLKQARGTGGQGVWRVELASRADGTPGPETPVLVQRSEPRTITPLEPMTLGGFLESCHDYFAWSGCLIDQPYQDRLADGMIRAYLVHDEVVGFCHQWPKGLLNPAIGGKPLSEAAPTMDDPDTPTYGSLRTKIESEWVPAMQDLLGIATHDLPVIWDADFLFGPKTDSGEDTYVLCEINVQAVWPYPPQASKRLARAALDRILAARTAADPTG